MSTNNALINWAGAAGLSHRVLLGRLVRMEPLDISRHGEDLWDELSGPKADLQLFAYMFLGPFENRADFDTFLAGKAADSDRKCYAAVDISNGRAQALLALMSTSEAHGTMRLDYVLFGASMQRSAKVTEALFLLADEAFAVGNRRLEWTCNNENTRAKRAAERFGFSFEGVFRQSFVAKGRNWDRAVHLFEKSALMSMYTALVNWNGATPLDHRILHGRLVRIEPLDVSRHGEDLWQEVNGPRADPKLFDHMFTGPFENRADFNNFLTGKAASNGRKCYTAVDLITEKAQALLVLVSMSDVHGTMSLEYILFGASMQRSAKSTEALFLLADETFALGYRRLEWTCSILNDRAKRATKRFGFTFEGVLRQFYATKGRNWDVAVNSILDREWPKLREGLTTWLAPENFDCCGRQIKTLECIREAIKEQGNEKVLSE